MFQLDVLILDANIGRSWRGTAKEDEDIQGCGASTMCACGSEVPIAVRFSDVHRTRKCQSIFGLFLNHAAEFRMKGK